MQYDFWNNPLVVSAMRLKYRRSAPGITTSLYLLILLTIGAVLHHYQDHYTMPPGRAFLLAIFGLQFLVSGGIALFSVANSMNAEVFNKTLDFQRIVSLPPRQILFGKMLGEPAISYFLTMATIPFALFCWLEGSTSASVIVWFYINLVTFTLLCAAVGTLHTLNPVKNTNSMGKANNGSIGMGLIWMPFALFPTFMSRGTGWLQDSWIGNVTNLCSPIGSLQFLYEGHPWGAKISLWNLAFPSLMIAPLIQLTLTHWLVTAMARRLQNPIDPPVKRLHAYLALLIFDLISVGVLFTQWQNGAIHQRLIYQFCLMHLIACLVLLFFLAPSKVALTSWLWRFQNRKPWLQDYSIGSRSEITMVLLIYCLIGGAVLLGGLVLPTSWGQNPANGAIASNQVLQAFVITSLLTLGLGLLYQVCLVVAGNSGFITYAIGLLLLNLAPLFIASAMLYPESLQKLEGNSATAASLSPAAFYLSHLDQSSFKSLPIPSLALATTILSAVCFFVLHKWLKSQKAVVTKKLTDMGAC